jgi:hypothetical protein
MIQNIEHELDTEYTSGRGWFFSLFAWGDNEGYMEGKEVFNSYGRRSNRHLMMNYGFSMTYNQHELLRFSSSIPPQVAVALDRDAKLVETTDDADDKAEERIQKRRQMGRLRIFEPFPVSLRADEFNQKFMGLCRLAAMDVNELRAHVDERAGPEGSEEPNFYAPSARFPSSPISRENEVKALKMVHSFMEEKIQSYRTSIEHDQATLKCACIQAWFRSAILYRLSLKMVLFRHKQMAAVMLESLRLPHPGHLTLESIYKDNLAKFPIEAEGGV